MFGDIDLQKSWKVCKSDFRIAYLPTLLAVDIARHIVILPFDPQMSCKVCDSEITFAYLPRLSGGDIAKHDVILTSNLAWFVDIGPIYPGAKTLGPIGKRKEQT